MSVDRRRAMIEPDHPHLSVVRQCALVSIGRSTFYRARAPETAENLLLMRLLDEQFLETPWYGSRQMARHLRRQGHAVGRKRVRRLMATMGLAPIYQRPRTTVPHPEHRIYPYLLRNLVIDRPNQVWCADVTYIPMRRGFLYLVAVMDWSTRRVLSWRLSNTMDVEFCIAALEEALARFGRPDIFNSDQGSQFTSPRFTEVLSGAGVRISMDGRGRWLDNVFIERLWRSLKCTSLDWTSRTLLQEVQPAWVRERSNPPSTALMPTSRRVGRGQVPQPRSGAPKAQGLTMTHTPGT
jgi:putative transposase